MSDKFYSAISITPETIYKSLHNDHNYFKNSQTIKHFYNLEQICQITMNKKLKDKINSFQDCTITGKGIKTLQGSQWLNDEVVNSYFQLVSDSSELSMFFVDSLNYQTFKNYQTLNVPYSLTKSKVSFGGLDLILIALNFARSKNDGHLGFAVVNVRDRIIKFYDKIL